MACRTGCRTKNHSSWGECMRASNIQMNAGDAKHTVVKTNKAWDAELKAYKSAREQGIQPAGTTMPKIQEAIRISDKTGKAYDASNPTASLLA